MTASPAGRPAGAALLAPVTSVQVTRWSRPATVTAAASAVAVAGLLVRSRFGLDSRAVHDEPAAAAVAGVEVGRTRWAACLIAALGFGAVGGMLLISLYTDPGTVFNVSYSAGMLFMVVIGGLGTMEGTVIGAVIFFLAQQEFARYGAWYLIALGGLAVVVVLTMPGGLWGTVAAPRGWSLLPVGYWIGGDARPRRRRN